MTEMTDFGNRTIDENGKVILSDAVSLIFSEKELPFNVVVNDSIEVQEYNSWAKAFDFVQLPLELKEEINHEKNQSKWRIPEEFLDFDIEEYLFSLCSSEEQINRVKEEFVLYKERNLVIMLKYLTYIVSIMRSESIVWGVGRGSSVSSYILFLIGLHKINSLKYNLDIREFLK